MEHARTQIFEIVHEVLDMAKLAAILFWMPIFVLVFLGLFIGFE